MSIGMTKADGVTVLTLTSDSQSSWPPLCQILKALCYNPVCCTVSQHLRVLQGKSQTVLGVSYNHKQYDSHSVKIGNDWS